MEIYRHRGDRTLEKSTYYVYILRCADGTLYTGFTTDWRRRFEEHRGGTARSAKYTLSHPPLCIEQVWQASTRSAAMQLEYAIKKHLTRAQKEALISSPDLLSPLLGARLECSNYQVVPEVSP